MEQSCLIRPADAANYLRVSRSTLYNWLEKGILDIPKVQLGPRAVAFLKKDIDAWIASHKTSQVEVCHE